MSPTITKPKPGEKIRICRESSEIAKRLGKKIEETVNGSETDGIQVKATIHKYEGNNLDIIYSELIIRGKEENGPSVHSEAVGEVLIKYKGEKVFEAGAFWDTTYIDTNTYVDKKGWKHKINAIYLRLQNP